MFFHRLPSALRGARVRLACAAACASASLVAATPGLLGADASEAAPPAMHVVIDPGHGGADHGARGVSGLLEKDVALAVGQKLGARLARESFAVTFTREDDRFVSLAERTELANRAGADYYLSIHANASPNHRVRGPETYFVSIDASDEEAKRVAMIENQVFDQEGAARDSGDLVASILGDLIRTEHLRGSSELARAIQQEFRALPGPARGVKQAPFVVLTGVNMPAVLIEIGFLTNATEERQLRGAKRREAIAAAVAEALVALRDGSAHVEARP